MEPLELFYIPTSVCIHDDNNTLFFGFFFIFNFRLGCWIEFPAAFWRVFNSSALRSFKWVICFQIEQSGKRREAPVLMRQNTRKLVWRLRQQRSPAGTLRGVLS